MLGRFVQRCPTRHRAFVSVEHPKVSPHEGSIERPVEANDQRLRGSMRPVDLPLQGIDARPDRRPHPVRAVSVLHEYRTVRVTDGSVDHECHLAALAEWWPGLLVRLEAAFDPTGLEQHRESTVVSIPELRWHLQQRPRQDKAGLVEQLDVLRSRSLFHLGRESHRETERVCRQDFDSGIDRLDSRAGGGTGAGNRDPRQLAPGYSGAVEPLDDSELGSRDGREPWCEPRLVIRSLPAAGGRNKVRSQVQSVDGND